MRMSTDSDRDEALARDTIAAALAAGVTVFDTAHAYGRGEAELGHNERLLAGALRDPRLRDRGAVRTAVPFCGTAAPPTRPHGSSPRAG